MLSVRPVLLCWQVGVLIDTLRDLQDRRGVRHLQVHSKGSKIHYVPRYPITATIRPPRLFGWSATTLAACARSRQSDNRVPDKYAGLVGIDVNGVGSHAPRATAATMRSSTTTILPKFKGLSDRARKRPGKLHADRAYASRAHCAWLRWRGMLASRDTAWSHANGLAAGVGTSNEPSGGFTDFADCRSATSAARTFIRPFSCWPARSSTGGTSTGIVRDT